MSYKQAMKWGRKHPKGTRQPVIMSTNSPWPAYRPADITCPTCGEDVSIYSEFAGFMKTEPCKCGKTFYELA